MNTISIRRFLSAMIVLLVAEAFDENLVVPDVNIRWVHMVKCGQTFATTVYAWGCEAKIATPAINFLVSSRSPGKVIRAAHQWRAENCSVLNRKVSLT
jgi:hypothetical protein